MLMQHVCIACWAKYVGPTSNRPFEMLPTECLFCPMNVCKLEKNTVTWPCKYSSAVRLYHRLWHWSHTGTGMQLDPSKNKETTTLINNGNIVFANYADIRGNCQVIWTGLCRPSTMNHQSVRVFEKYSHYKDLWLVCNGENTDQLSTHKHLLFI